jgi:hypothetical protein
METVQPNIPEYTECYVAFLDVLGFSNHIVTSGKNPEQLNAIIRILSEAISYETTRVSWTPKPTVEGEKKQQTHWRTEYRAFSDNIVLFVPTQSLKLNDILQVIGYFVDRFIQFGFFLRGAVTVGGMYWNSDWSTTNQQQSTKEVSGSASITFGPALVEAYRLEKHCAKYPRIIFSQNLMQHIRSKGSAPFSISAQDMTPNIPIPFFPITHYCDVPRILRSDIDPDGFEFLDTFNPAIPRIVLERSNTTVQDGGKNDIARCITHGQYMADAKTLIEKCLSTATCSTVRQKYLWLAKYFNKSIDHDTEITPIEISEDIVDN